VGETHRSARLASLSASYGVTDAMSTCGERYHLAEDSRLRGRLSLTGGSPKAIGCEVIRDLEAFSAGRDQFDDITLICFGPVASCLTWPGLPVWQMLPTMVIYSGLR
jgi:hypothetical protein